MKPVKRKLFKTGGSVAVTIPDWWVKLNELTTDDMVQIDGTSTELAIKPAGDGKSEGK